MIKGSCLCGNIKYELDKEPLFINYCYCTNCQKASGSAFCSSLQVLGIDGFKWLEGEEFLSTYESSPGNNRVFCKECGTRMPMIRETHITIPSGTLDNDPGVRPVVNIFTSEKAFWHEITNSLPCFDEQAPQEFWAKWLK